MKNLNLALLLTLVLIVSISSCKKKKVEEEEKPTIENPGPNVSANPAVLDLGNDVNAKFFARIVDENNNAVEHATVKVGNKSAITDENGIAIISNANVPEKLAYLTVQKTGYFLGSRSVIPQVSSVNEINIMILKRDIIATINSGSAATVSISSGLTIEFEGDYVKTDGSIYEGSVNVSMKHIDPSSDDFSNQMPGSLFAQNESNNSGVLESYGMGAIEISTTSGEELQIANGSKATMHMPIDNSQLADAPNTIPLWHFDEIAGYWIEEGQATLINGEYVGEVKHFSFWNCDVFLDDASINGNIVDGQGNTIGYGSVQIVTPNASTVGQISGNGSFFSYIPANVPVTFNVLDDCGIQLTTWTNTFTTNASPSHTFTVAASSVNNVTGTLIDCNNNAITNGYVVLTSGSHVFFPTLNSSGQFNVNIGNCNTTSNFTIEGFDYTALQSSGLLSFTTTIPLTNVGNIITCNAASEYITYTVDSDPATSFFVPITCVDSSSFGGPTTSVEIYANAGNNYFSLILENNVVGGYNFADYGTTTPGAYLSVNNPVINVTGGYPNILFNLNTHGAVGTYIDITFSGTYLDQSNLSHTISGTLHVLRDS